MARKLNLKEQTLVLPDGEVRPVLDVFSESDFIQHDGQEFIKLAPLLRNAKKIFGIKSYTCRVIQVPVADNDWQATIKVRYVLTNETIWEACADCRASTAQPGFESYSVAMAESRAKARALRDMFNLDVCSIDEITKNKDKSSVASKDTDFDDDLAEPTQVMLIEKKFLGEADKTMNDIEEIVGRKVTLNDLTRTEAAMVLEAFNKTSRSRKKE